MTTLAQFRAEADDEACFEACFRWILGNVSAEMFQLGLATNNVVERFALPKRASSLKVLVDVVGAAAFPRTQDFAQSDFFGRFDQGMKMIGHHAPSIEMVSLTVSGEQTSDQKISAGFPCEHAITMACIQQIVKFGRKLAVIGFSLLVRQAVEFVWTCKLVRLQPSIAFPLPFDGELGRDGVSEPGSDEVNGAPLPPMRQILPVDGRFGIRIVRLEWESRA